MSTYVYGGAYPDFAPIRQPADMGSRCCNVYSLVYPDDVATEINQISFTTIFTDVSSAIYSWRTYPFSLPQRNAEKIRVCNSQMSRAVGFRQSRIIKLRLATFDGASSRYKNLLSTQRRFLNAQLYIPYIGFIPFDMSHLWDNVVIDLVTGHADAYVTVDDVVVSIANGRIGEDVFYGQSNVAQIARNTALTGLTAGVGAIASAATGNIPGLVGSVLSGTTAIASQQENVRRGSVGTSSSARSAPQTPYILIEYAEENAIYLRDFASMRGRPCEKVVRIGDMSGFTRFSEIHTDGLGAATASEQEEIVTLLREGVIL